MTCQSILKHRHHVEADMQTLCSFIHNSTNGCLDKEDYGCIYCPFWNPGAEAVNVE